MERGSGGEPSSPSRPAAPPGRGGLAARGSEEVARPRRARGCRGPAAPGHRRGAAEAKLQHGARRGVRGLGRPRSRGVRVVVTKICRTRTARAPGGAHLVHGMACPAWLAFLWSTSPPTLEEVLAFSLPLVSSWASRA